MLVLVGTPIGNLDDLSPRAVRTLAEADVVLCEDTRRTGRLLQAAGVHARRLLAVHDHNEAAQVRQVLALIDRGRRVVVVSDAGTPAISDPGERLVAAALTAGHDVTVVPGPSAAVAALVLSGLPTGRFVFEGFLPRKGAGRTERLAAVAHEPRTTVLYEAPHRLARTLADAVAWAEERQPPGEMVIVLAGAPPAAPPDDDDVLAALRDELAAGATARDAARSVATRLAVPRRRAYDLAVRVSPPR